jgi:hypothetical protein
MRSVHLVIPDLFLPKDFAVEASRGLSLPALEKLLGRGRSEILEPVSLESHLCELFGVPDAANAPIAPISATYDGLLAGCWLRADPVHLHLHRDQLLMSGVQVSSEEASALCVSLNEHFAGQRMEFFAPHPQRWYVRLDILPRIHTTPLSQVIGGDVRKVLPTGDDALHWNRLFNEMQMLLFAHLLNDAREERGDMSINSLWFWGCGCSENTKPQKNYGNVTTDDVMAKMFAKVSVVPCDEWPKQWRQKENHGRQLLLWTGLQSALQRGDLASWRTALQEFESAYAQPLWQALCSGKIAQLQVDILSADNISRMGLTRGDGWAFWRRAKRLSEYSLV